MSKLSYISEVLERNLDVVQPLTVKGRVREVVGTIIEAVVPVVEVGEICELRKPGESHSMLAEVVGFSKDAALLTPLGPMEGLSSNVEVIPTGRSHTIPVGPGLLGRVLNGLGDPMDETEKGPLECDEYYPVYRQPPNPLQRSLVEKPLSLGVRAIDGILTCGEGQRMGIFAAAGGGKSTLLAMLVKGADVDVTVVALVGERGREVREFIERELGEEGMRKSVLVVATSDKPAMERLKAAHVATAIAEYFRDMGKRVLLLMDSVTRFARACREIGLAAGEPPTRRGYPPSVFSALPVLLERTGPAQHGSITALYTVLVEGDDMSEPVADETRSILDGHIILSRKLAAAYHYPAIDIMASASRVMNAVAQPQHVAAAGQLRKFLARYQEIELLVQIGEYQRGNDAASDAALDKIAAIKAFLQQKTDEHTTLDETLKHLQEVVA